MSGKPYLLVPDHVHPVRLFNVSGPICNSNASTEQLRMRAATAAFHPFLTTAGSAPRWGFKALPGSYCAIRYLVSQFPDSCSRSQVAAFRKAQSGLGAWMEYICRKHLCHAIPSSLTPSSRPASPLVSQCRCASRPVQFKSTHTRLDGGDRPDQPDRQTSHHTPDRLDHTP